MTVMYEIDEANFINTIYFYDDKEIGNNIDIAVSKNNPDKVRCCILNDEVYDKIYEDFTRLITLFIGVECIFLIFKLVLKKLIKKSDNISIKRINEEKEIRIRFVEKELEEKQKIILTYCKDLREDSLSIDKITDIIAKYDIDLNNEHIWCLTNLSLEKMADFNLLPLEGESSVVSETMQLRESGLPYEYYVIAKIGDNYLCGRADLQRIYCFSYALGITNTPYATIYDYIIEQIDKG